jgi:Mn2+/Fe2+ NRAMP family transporter
MSNNSKLSLKKGLLSILFWSVISAAFIGPGTVTTASTAGALFGLDLIWALAFATIACIVVQEAAARVTIGSGKTMGEAIAIRYGSSRLKIWLAIAVIFGCAAYQAGNILGAVNGAKLAFDFPTYASTLAIVGFCAILLWFGRGKAIIQLLGILVALLGIMFIIVASGIEFSGAEFLARLFKPALPEGSELIAIGLIGTTIVPYNLFLGSGISHGQSLIEMRIGIFFAVLIGGFISLAVLLTGTAVEGEMSFPALTSTLVSLEGPEAGYLFGLGLFAAGFTSSMTAPLASAITARNLLASPEKKWSASSKPYRITWGLVLGSGFLFGMSNTQAIPVIIAAQAINGLLLPFVTVFLLFVINDRSIMNKDTLNKGWQNILMLVIVLFTCFLGIFNVYKALSRTLGLTGDPGTVMIIVFGIAILITLWAGQKALQREKSIPGK